MATPAPKKPTTIDEFYSTDQSNWEWITVPAKDPLGKPAPKFTLNRREFEPGQRYLVPPEIANELRDRIEVFQASIGRLLQDTIDYKALSAVRGPQ